MEFKKENKYYSVVRHDIIEVVPDSVKTLLEVGCGFGYTSKIIKDLLNIQYTMGIEISEKSARIASNLLDKVLICDIEQEEPDLPLSFFDCIICADVLEHLRNPWSTLEMLKKYLNNEGIIIASIPNIRNIQPLMKILFNKFEYESEGILDITHLRFFTLHTIRKMFRDSGYDIFYVRRNKLKGWKAGLFSFMTFGLLDSFLDFQYIIIAGKA